MPVKRRADNENICAFDFGKNFIELVARKFLTIDIDAVIDKIQRLIFFAL